MHHPSAQARAIARGLILSGRGRRQQDIGDGYIALERRAGGFYFVPFRGDELRQGPTLAEAEPLQPSFVAAMMAKAQSGGNGAR